MSIPSTIPVVTLARADLVQVVTSKLAILPTADGAVQKNFVVLSSNFRPPATQFLDHAHYSAATGTIDIDITMPVQNDIPTIACVVEGFHADFVEMFVNAACPFACEARFWAQAIRDAADTVRLITDDFGAWAYISGELALVREGWAQATIMLRVNGAKPQWEVDYEISPPPAGPTVTDGACVSLTGTGYLRGWSKFQNQNSGDWNYRKATKVSYVQTPADGVNARFHTLDGCIGDSFIGEGLTIVSGVSEWDVASDTIQAPATFGTYVHCSWPALYSSAAISIGGYGTVLAAKTGGITGEFVANWIYTTGDYPGPVCYNMPGMCGGAKSYSQTPPEGQWVLAETLHTPDFVSAALARGAPVVGALTQTTAGAIAPTTVGSATQMLFDNTTSVSVPFAAAGLTEDADYELTIPIERYIAAGGAYVDTITATVLFTAAGATEDIDYEVPVNTDYDYKYAGGVTIAAA